MTVKGKTIGIGGISRSGKSYLAQRMADLFEAAGKKVVTFDQDDFVFHGSRIPVINNHIDWECPESIDFKRFNQAIIEALDNNDIIIAEGLMVFWNPEIFKLFDYNIFIKLHREEFIKRKKTDLRWGIEPDWYIEHIWEGYQNYGQFPDGLLPDMVLDGNQLFNIDEIYQQIIRHHTIFPSV